MGSKPRPARSSRATSARANRSAARRARAVVPQLDDALDEELADTSGLFAISHKLAAGQRDVDEDETKRYRDPSLIMRVQGKGRREDLRPPGADDAIELGDDDIEIA